MRFGERLVEGTFLRRWNRFACSVEVDGEPVRVHLPNSGRLGELLVAGREAFLLRRAGSHRKTAYDLVLVRTPSGMLVSTDARLPNRLFREYLSGARDGPSGEVTSVRSEVARGRSRLDFLLQTGDGPVTVEVKSVTLVEEGCGLFPDGPTLRGARHVRELLAVRNAGERAAVVFVVQRSDVRRVKPNDETDPDFGHALREAAAGGVAVHAFRCRVDRRGVRISDEIPVRLTPGVEKRVAFADTDE